VERRECRTTSSRCKAGRFRKETAASQGSNRKGKIPCILEFLVEAFILILKGQFTVISERYDSSFGYGLTIIIKMDKLYL